jgi:hypothetical protein
VAPGTTRHGAARARAAPAAQWVALLIEKTASAPSGVILRHKREQNSDFSSRVRRAHEEAAWSEASEDSGGRRPAKASWESWSKGRLGFCPNQGGEDRGGHGGAGGRTASLASGVVFLDLMRDLRSDPHCRQCFSHCSANNVCPPAVSPSCFMPSPAHGGHSLAHSAKYDRSCGCLPYC